MAITPTSDFVLDVARAADPAKANAAEARLLSGDSSSADSSQSFGQELQSLQSNSVGIQSDAGSSLSALSSVTSPFRVKTPESPGQKFEAVVLKTFVESMLPQKADSVFGGGYAGGVWKSFLAEMVASKVASRGGIGIAAQVNKALSLRAESQKKQST